MSFHIYFEDGVDDVIPQSVQEVVIEYMWGWSDERIPGDAFDVVWAPPRQGYTIREALRVMWNLYVHECEKRGWVPRQAYGYEMYHTLDEGRVISICLGT